MWQCYLQVGQLLLLWAIFLTFQLVKSKYGNCTKQYLLLLIAQTVFCISVTTFYMRRELADLGKPAAQQNGDPEMHQLLLGQRDGASEGASPLPPTPLGLVLCMRLVTVICLLVMLFGGCPV